MVAGLEHAVELARLAMEDTGFGVFEDKVVKNYIAYTTYVAPEKYAQMAWVHGLGRRSEEERRTRLFSRVEGLLDVVGIPRSLAEAGVGEPEFEAAVPELAEAAFMDPSTRTNPRMPLVAELVDLLRAGWTGR